LKLHDRWEIDPVREKKPFRVGITIPLERSWWRRQLQKMRARACFWKQLSAAIGGRKGL
jgi:hypothetical protein